MVVRGSCARMKATEPFLVTNFVNDRMDLKAQFLMVKIKELTSKCF